MSTQKIQFAEITHIDQVREVIGDSEFFRIYTKDGYSVANYISIVAKFPDWSEGRESAIMRECRGLLFCNDTGKILRRPFEKFHNLGEREETRYENLDWSTFEVYDKLDGSMVAPFMLQGELRWGTKAGITHMTPDIENFVERNIKYVEFAQELVSAGWTPIFEFMAPQHRIVINYGSENMVLLAIRNIILGEYKSYEVAKELADSYNIPIVNRWLVEDSESLTQAIRDMRGIEGVVALTGSGLRVKLKTLDYMDLHKNREAIAKEKYVVGLILNERIDDAIGLVPDHVKPRLIDYTESFLNQYKFVRNEAFFELYNAIQRSETRKDFALMNDLPHFVKWIGFKMFDTRNEHREISATAFEELFKDMILKSCNRSDTDFEKEVREGVFNNTLPEWNIWENTVSIDD